ncbi:MAG: ZIP family metal transporter, partial [Thermococcus sp.]
MLEGFIEGLAKYLLDISGGSLIWVSFYAGLFVALMTSLGAMVALL